MANAGKESEAAAYAATHNDTEGERLYTWLEDYLERFEGKDAYREFQERYYRMSEYYAIVASLAA
jgi:hypothetical protein